MKTLLMKIGCISRNACYWMSLVAMNMISKAFKERESEIMAHNERMGVNETTNRKLSLIG